MCPPPPPSFLLNLLSNYHQSWHDSSLRQNLSKAEKVKSIMVWLWRHLCSDEYPKLLKTVYIRAGASSATFIWSYSNLAETFSTNTAFDWKCWIWINRCFPCSYDVINIIPAFWQINTRQSLIFQLPFKKFPFLKQIMKKYAMVEISTIKKIICDIESINMWIWVDEVYRFTDFSNICLHHHDIITILYLTYVLRSHYRNYGEHKGLAVLNSELSKLSP